MEHIGSIMKNILSRYHQCEICNEFYNKDKQICDGCEIEIDEVMKEAEDW
jgi:recombinational DNA repair protein RecR